MILTEQVWDGAYHTWRRSAGGGVHIWVSYRFYFLMFLILLLDENLVFCPEKTLTQVISHIHYFPEDWKGNAHTYKVETNLEVFSFNPPF